MKGDKELRLDVLDELRWEPSIDAAKIGVTGRDGVVALTGSAPTYTEKLSAERVAQRVRGVKAVANAIEVRFSVGAERADAAIVRAAIDALKWRVCVPEKRVAVSVSNGWVTLQGDVDWYHQKEAAQEAVQALAGVRAVINDLIVKPRAQADDVKSLIEAAFWRSAEVDAKHVCVETTDGKVILRGEVHSWSERRQAEQTAWSAPSVAEVENLITLVPWGT